MTGTLSATFRAKTNFMKSWRPRNPPSNRDRLELYALHKQSASGDAPELDDVSATSSSSLSSSVADKAKLAAWRAKRGMSQAEAMDQYIDECDRQLQSYGTHESSTPPRSPLNPHNAQRITTANNGGEATTTSANGNGSSAPNTPHNTPAANQNGEDGDAGVLLCPRGLAAIPLLCAAASESRSAYLARLQVTHPSNGWWAKQEPLCLEVNNPLSIPEKLIIELATNNEKISLIFSNYMGEGHAVSIMSPRVLQAFLWPVHNVFLCVWICLILTTTYLGSMIMMIQTILFGTKRTNVPLARLFMEEVHPSARAVASLCEQHQVIGVRVAGLALMPLMMLCDFATSVVERVGVLVGSMVFVGMGVCGWWYWLCVLPWLAVCGLSLGLMSGWCFALIELAGN